MAIVAHEGTIRRYEKVTTNESFLRQWISGTNDPRKKNLEA